MSSVLNLKLTTFNLKVRNPGTVEKMIANSDELTDGTEGVDGTDG